MPKLPKHNSDRITRRMLPWVFLLAIAGILYIVYAPFHQTETSVADTTAWQEEDWFDRSESAHDTASQAQSLSTEEYQALQKAQEAAWYADIVQREIAQQQAVADNQDGDPVPETAETDMTSPTDKALSDSLREAEREEKTIAQEDGDSAEESAAEEETAAKQTTANQTNTVSAEVAPEKPTVESPDVSVSRGVFEKRLLIIGRSNNAWQSIVMRKNINPVLLEQLEGLVKRLAQPHKSVEILYSDYVRNGTVDPANSKLLAVRTAQWAYFTNEEGGKLYFYDMEGNAPEPSMDRAPFRYSHVTSEFNPNRLHPITRRVRPHLGVDLKGPHGTPIASTGVGIVSFAGWQGGYGRIVIVQHPNQYETRYAHLSSIEVEVGQQVKRGQIIGKLGNSGLSTGAHLHFEVRISGTPYDPMTVKLPSYRPLRRSDLPVFQQYANLYLQAIDELKALK